MLGCDTEYLNRLTPSEEKVKTNQLEADRRMYYQGSQIRQAIFDTLIMLNPETEYYYRQKSIAHTKIGDYHIAFPLLEKSAELDPKESLYYYSWLLLYLYRDYERALERLQQYDDLTPNQMDVAWGENVDYLKGLAHKQLGNYPEAIRAFTKAIEEEGAQNVDLYAFVYRGIAYAQMADHREAILDFDQAIQLYQKCTMAYYYKAVSLAALGQREKASTFFTKAEELLRQGIKKTDPYVEVFDEVHLEMIEDQRKNL